MKYLFYLVTAVFSLAGTEWLFLEMPSLFRYSHTFSRPFPLFVLFAALLTFTYGLIGVLLLLTKKATPIVMRNYLIAVGVTILLFFVIPRTVGQYFQIYI